MRPQHQLELTTPLGPVSLTYTWFPPHEVAEVDGVEAFEGNEVAAVGGHDGVDGDKALAVVPDGVGDGNRAVVVVEWAGHNNLEAVEMASEK